MRICEGVGKVRVRRVDGEVVYVTLWRMSGGGGVVCTQGVMVWRVCLMGNTECLMVREK